MAPALGRAMPTLAQRIAARFAARLAREGEIGTNPAIDAMGAHLNGDTDDPSPQVSTPAAERFNTNPNPPPFPGGFGGEGTPPFGGNEGKPPQKNIPGERSVQAGNAETDPEAVSTASEKLLRRWSAALETYVRKLGVPQEPGAIDPVDFVSRDHQAVLKGLRKAVEKYEAAERAFVKDVEYWAL